MSGISRKASKRDSRGSGHSSHGSLRALRFKCEHPGCGKMFNRRDYLERHAANHLDVKPFVCRICDRSFSRKDLYDNHLATKVHTRRVLEVEQGLTESTQVMPELEYDTSAPPDWGETMQGDMTSGADRTQPQSNGEVDLGNFVLKSMWAMTEAPNSQRPHSGGSILPAAITGSGESSSTRSDEFVSTPSRVPKDLKGGLAKSNTLEELLANPEIFVRSDWKPPKFFRSPLIGDEQNCQAYDSIYQWFFDDNFTTEKAKFGYDNYGGKEYSEYARRLEGVDEARHEVPVISKVNARKVLHVLNIVDSDLWIDPSSIVNDLMLRSWDTANLVPVLVHRPTHDPNRSNMALLAVLTLLGMALSPEPRLNDIAKSTYPAVFLYCYNALESRERRERGSESSRYDPAYVGFLPAFFLLLKYEPSILREDLASQSIFRSDLGPEIVDRFSWTALCYIPHLDQISCWSGGCECAPIWSTISLETYIFHEGVDPEAQWREWAAIEICKRSAFYAVYHDNDFLSRTAGRNKPALSLFNLDTHVVCPRSLWDAQTAVSFFHVIGPSRTQANIPFLGVLKALVRFPRTLSIHEPVQQRQIVSIFYLELLSFGISDIYRYVLRSKHLQSEWSPVSLAFGPPPPEKPRAVPLLIEQDLQERLYRGLDIWFQYFKAYQSHFAEMLFKVGGAPRSHFAGELFVGGEGREQEIPLFITIAMFLRASLFIVMHDDLSVIFQVASNLKKWLAHLESDQTKDQEELLKYLYMPLYVEWLETEESRAFMSTSALYIALIDEAVLPVARARLETVFYFSLLFICSIALWLFDVTSSETSSVSAKLRLQNFAFVDDALAYLHSVFLYVSGRSDKIKPTSHINAVLLLVACILNQKPQAKPYVDILVGLLEVVDDDYSAEDFEETLQKSKEYYLNRNKSSTIYPCHRF